MNDRFNLSRFIEAQEGDYSDVLDELKRGKKAGHWIWYVFPQMASLGHSEMSEKYSISCINEARAYIGHAILGPRLVECTELVLAVEGKAAEQILGSIDAMKFHSSMTLFSRVGESASIYQHALSKYFDGEPDPKTLKAM